MSDNTNPYQTPVADLNASKPAIESSGLTEAMIKYLREASPWLRFIGIMLYIGAGITAIAGIGIIIAFPLLAVAATSGMGAETLAAGFMGAAMGIVYLLLGIILFFPARFTYNFGAKIRNYMQSHNDRELELAFKNNKSLWKFCGILCIIYVAIIPVGIVITVITSFIASGLF
ncbi:MAG: hypothetical protein FWC36_01825 [Spirochaetes bacterium]|nr:hypothetical protein [Spirochaetota bacterium]